MTATPNTDGLTVTVAVNGKNVTIATADVTDLLVALLAARKDAYQIQRVSRQAAQAAKKAERDAAKAARLTAATEKKAARAEKLRAQLAALDA